MKLYKNFLIAACYDGNIYIFNLDNDEAAVNICGPSNMLLAMDLWDDKVRKNFRLAGTLFDSSFFQIIASTKDKTLKIIRALDDVKQKQPDPIADEQIA